jgi:hypothetical protein
MQTERAGAVDKTDGRAVCRAKCVGAYFTQDEFLEVFSAAECFVLSMLKMVIEGSEDSADIEERSVMDMGLDEP